MTVEVRRVLLPMRTCASGFILSMGSRNVECCQACGNELLPTRALLCCEWSRTRLDLRQLTLPVTRCCRHGMRHEEERSRLDGLVTTLSGGARVGCRRKGAPSPKHWRLRREQSRQVHRYTCSIHVMHTNENKARHCHLNQLNPHQGFGSG